MFQVKMIALVAGNPHKAWRGSTGLDDTEHVPDDVWEDQVYEFGSLDEAKSFVAGLPAESTTHVEIFDESGMMLFHQDGGDVLDDVEEGTESPWKVGSSATEDAEEAVPEAPPVMPSQQSAAPVPTDEGGN